MLFGQSQSKGGSGGKDVYFLTFMFQYLRNWFDKERYFADFVISNGVLTYANGSPVPLVQDQYYRIVGSVFNDGVHFVGYDDLQDEQFTGAVWALAVPQAVLDLAKEIQTWMAANSDVINSPYQSESFGGYSYSLNSSGPSGVSWQSKFAAYLAPWRRI